MSDINVSTLLSKEAGVWKGPDLFSTQWSNGEIGLLLRSVAYGAKVFGIRSSDELTIPGTKDVYMRRHFLWKDDNSNARIHEILRADHERDLHDHPWAWAFSLILSGGYDEEKLVGDRIVRLNYQTGDHNMIKGGEYHRISNVLPDTVTLFLSGRYVPGGWGFLVDGKHIPSDLYKGRLPPFDGIEAAQQDKRL